MAEFLKEDVVIPAVLSQQYLVVKKQIADKQTQRDLLMKQVNQKENEINILTKNLIAIESKAAQLQGKEAAVKTGETAKPENREPSATQNESLKISDLLAELNEMDQEWIFEDDEADEFAEGEPDQLTPEEMEEEEDEADFVFAIKVITEDEEEIIAKVYRNEGDEFWKIRVVKGEEIPLETMQYDPDMEFVDVMEKIGEIPGYDEVEEIPMEDYKEMLDDKAEIDAKYYPEEEL